MDELKPCPFCGDEAHMSASSDGYGVTCWNRRCIDMQLEQIPTEAEAIEAWNTRTEQTCHEVMVDKYFHGCGACGYVWEVFYNFGKRERPKYCPECGLRVAND